MMRKIARAIAVGVFAVVIFLVMLGAVAFLMPGPDLDEEYRDHY